jgi:uncharacterized protein (TIGR02246 family)
MNKMTAMTAALLAGACLGIGPPGVRAQPAQAPKPGAAAPAAEKPKAGPAERPEDVKALGALVEAFTKAYNAGDAKALADLFTEDAEVFEETGGLVRGREEIAGLFAAAFEEEPKGTIELAPESLRFLGPDAARETGRSRTMPAGGGAGEVSRYTVLYVRRDGRWLQDSVHEEPDRAVTPHDRLRELEWLVGEWIDESDEGVVHTSCRWSEDGNFLIRDFTLKIAGQAEMAGTQRIGWDPRSEQFKTWVFDADGGHSEGLWNRHGKDQWVIKAAGVLADGRGVSATQVLTFVSKDLARWRSVDRTVGGEAVPDLPEIVLARTPPRPASSLPAPKSARKP